MHHTSRSSKSAPLDISDHSEAGRTLVGVDKPPISFFKPSSEMEEDIGSCELNDDGSVSVLEIEPDFFDLENFPGMILISFIS